MADDALEFNEIKQLIATIQPLAPVSGRGDALLGWLAQAQGTEPHLDHPRLCLFSATHGFARDLDLKPPFDYDKFIQDSLQGTGRLNRLAVSANTDLRLYEMDGEDDPEDELSTSDLVRSMAYGMMAVEPGLDLAAAGAFGSGSDLAARALICLHDDSKPDDLTVARLAKSAQGLTGLAALAKVGGYEIAALCGLIMAARLANCPVLLEGPQGLAAYLILQAENPALIEHCRLCGVYGVDEAQLEISTPEIATSEPGLNLACSIQQLRTHVILNDGVNAARQQNRAKA